MSIRWDASGFSLAGVEQALADGAQDAAQAGAKVILEDALARVPKETGDLAGTGRVDSTRGGGNTVAVVFDSVYAHWIHEHLHFKHPHGGQAKFLETAMLTRKDAALKAMAERIKAAL